MSHEPPSALLGNLDVVASKVLWFMDLFELETDGAPRTRPQQGVGRRVTFRVQGPK